MEAFEFEHDRILVLFDHGGCYEYTYESAGPAHVEEMKRLAAQGEGLASYIKRHVGKGYSAEW